MINTFVCLPALSARCVCVCVAALIKIRLYARQSLFFARLIIVITLQPNLRILFLLFQASEETREIGGR